MNLAIVVMTGIALLIGGFFLGHEFGYADGQQYQKYVNNEKLQSCQRIIAGSIYE